LVEELNTRLAEAAAKMGKEVEGATKELEGLRDLLASTQGENKVSEHWFVDVLSSLGAVLPVASYCPWVCNVCSVILNTQPTSCGARICPRSWPATTSRNCSWRRCSRRKAGSWRAQKAY
jgi:hypothetical protein